MKATTAPMAGALAGEKSLWAVLSELFKARLTVLVLLTTLAGYHLGAKSGLDYVLLVHLLIGTGLVACGASALNQLREREYDARMRRTEDRPLPSGRLKPDTVLVMGAGCAVAGLIELALGVNVAVSFIGVVTLVTYVFVYTPLKRLTWLNTAVGAIPGALPPMMGWVAARGEATVEGWSLFAILYFWQIPHFLAIAWIYRDEYARAGFVMLPSLDPEGLLTGRHAVSHAFGLVLMSLFPFAFKLVGTNYLAAALVLGLGFLWCAMQFARHLTIRHARWLFLASVVYLPLLLILMAVDKK